MQLVFCFFSKTIISLTFLCTVPSTWKNKGGVQEKLGIELTFRVDKSLLLLQAFFFVVEKKQFFFSFFSLLSVWHSVGELLLRKPSWWCRDLIYLLFFYQNTSTSYSIRTPCVRVCVRGGPGGCLWMMLLVFGGLESFSSHGFGGWTDSSWVDSLL